MKPIWYFVGVLLFLIGLIITISGLYSLFNPPVESKVLAHLHPDIWWGLIMVAAGCVFLLLNRKKVVQ